MESPETSTRPVTSFLQPHPSFAACSILVQPSSRLNSLCRYNSWLKPELSLAQPHRADSPHSSLRLLQRSARRPAVAVELPTLSRRCSSASHGAAAVFLPFATCCRQKVQSTPDLPLRSTATSMVGLRSVAHRPKDRLRCCCRNGLKNCRHWTSSASRRPLVVGRQVPGRNYGVR
ncbi:hypothetical protein AAHA92_14604 [Salvia divinorum]|uniref:Uncharacterized protein n=1 Tax=Salvia divinorum TaxID=28513 RepID=A0ABD1HEN3_SALDI